MAKGLRSKSKRRFRAIKRETVFGPVEDSRTERLAEKQANPAVNLHPEILESLSKLTANTTVTETSKVSASLETKTAGTRPTNTVEVNMVDSSTLPDSSVASMDIDTLRKIKRNRKASKLGKLRKKKSSKRKLKR